MPNSNTNIQIDGIYLSSIASGPMISKPKNAKLIKGIGLEGDRYANRKGTYSVLGKEPGRQLTLISLEGIKEGFATNNLQKEWDDDKSRVVGYGDLRRNIILRGISSKELLACIGSIIELGGDGTAGSSAKVFVHRNCVPCMYNERKNQIKGLMEALWDSGGVCCEVLEGGTISVGDTVTIRPPPPKNDDDASSSSLVPNDGGKPSWFYIPPSKRTAEMIKEFLEAKRKLYESYKISDPEGVKRIQDSYESVGLSFWPKSPVSSSSS